MATELGRVASAAIRCARIPSRTPSSLFSAQSNCRQLPATSITTSLRCLSINTTQARHASAWTSPARSGRGGYAAGDSNITKPTTATRPWRSTATPDLPDPDSTKPEPVKLDEDEDILKAPLFKVGELNKNNRLSDDGYQMVASYPDIRCVPRTGRTVQVSKGGADAARSIKLLNMQCASNRVRQDFQAQRYHERNGLKRKRLRSERWRRRFKKAFKNTCKRVDELRRQGW